jgi:class 3 adenylate cyclase
MERFSAWLWRRFRTHYAALLVIQMLVWPTIVIIPSIYSGWRTLGLPTERLWPAVATVMPIYAGVATLAAIYLGRPAARALGAWGRRENVDPQATREALAGLYRVPLLAVIGGLVPSTIAMAFALDAAKALADWPTRIVWVATGWQVLFGCAAFVWLMGDTLTRPVRAELDAAIGEDSPEPVRRGIASRLMVMILLVSLIAGYFSALPVSWARTDIAQYIASGLIVPTLAAFCVLVFSAFGIVPVTQPVKELTRGTERVTAGDFSERIPVTSNDEFGVLARSFNRMQAGLLERERLHAAFGSYVDPALAERLLADGSDTFDGEAVDVTVFFADVRGFTTYSEAHSPEESVARLNELFALTVPILLDHGGHANKFLGDGVLAVFGVPNRLEDHADRAVDAAIAVQHRVRRQFGDELKIGIGINTGPVIAGTIGGGGKLEFTLIGDTVNVAARIEELTKATGDAILIAEATRQALNRPVGSVERGSFDIRGRNQGIELHAVAPW